MKAETDAAATKQSVHRRRERECNITFAQGQTEIPEVNPVSHRYNIRPERSSWKRIASSHCSRQRIA